MFMLNGYKHLRFYLKEEENHHISSLNMINDRCPEKGWINSDWLYDKLMAIIASQ